MGAFRRQPITRLKDCMHSEVLHTLGSGFELVQLEGDLLYRRPPS
jgi:hypothetical protein